MNRAKFDKNYWELRWSNGETGWDMGGVSRPIQEFVDQLADKSMRILIPGCGNAWEAEYLWKSGFSNTNVVDISDKAIASFVGRCPGFPKSQILHGDFFALQGSYDLIIEQTFFCALDPNQRDEYAAKCFGLLAKNGMLAGVLFDFPLEDGPPFGGNETEYRTLFGKFFRIEKLERCYNSIKPRAGRELFIRLTNKSS